jgi:hypothetical protein
MRNCAAYFSSLISAVEGRREEQELPIGCCSVPKMALIRNELSGLGHHELARHAMGSFRGKEVK